MDQLLQDLKFGIRLLARAPAFTVGALLALGIGVGATTSIFTVLDRVVLRPLPYPGPDRLAMVWETDDSKGLQHQRLSPVNFVDYRALSQVFDDAAAWWYPQLNLTQTGRDPMRINAVEVSANFFAVIGVQPALGAGFPAAPLYSRDPVVVISHRLWRERFSGDPAIVGRPVTLNSRPFTVAGVMPAGFQYPGDTDVWQRLTWNLAQHSRGAHFVESLFRLRAGVTLGQANSELRALTARLGREHVATNGGWHARAVPLATEVVGFFRPALFALFAAAAFLLVIACTNVAGLLLARATAREREVAVRVAIGASRGRLVRQFLTESALLSTLGAALGFAVSIAAVKMLLLVSPVQLPRLDVVAVDPRVLLFATALAASTTAAFGAAPALFMARGDVQRPFGESGRGFSSGASRRRARSALVTAEVGLAVVLLVGAALLARSFQRLLSQDVGFRRSGVVSVSMELPYSYTDFRRIADFYARLLASIRNESGVTNVGASNFLPLEAAWRLPFVIDRRPRPSSGDEPQAQHQTVDEGYFRCLGVPLLKGRTFDERDTATAPAVVVINDALARREFPDQDALGRILRIGVRVIGPMGQMLMPPDAPFAVVGIVANVKNQSLVQDPEPAIYFTFRQFPFRGLHIVVQGPGRQADLVGAVRVAVRRMDPDLPLASARSLEQIVGGATDRSRALMLLMGVFAAMALALAALGIYSLLSYAVSQRQQELSVRLALGAQPRDLLWLVVRQGLALTLAGAAIGVAGALALARALSSLLYGVPARDPTAFSAAVLLALVSASLACWLPGRRAAALNAVDGLRA